MHELKAYALGAALLLCSVAAFAALHQRISPLQGERGWPWIDKQEPLVSLMEKPPNGDDSFFRPAPEVAHFNHFNVVPVSRLKGPANLLPR